MISRIIVLVLGLLVIGLIIWWFFGKHKIDAGSAEVNQGKQVISIDVMGGYSPEVINLKKGIPAVLQFTRHDKSNCLDRVVFSDFGVNKELPINEQVNIDIPTDKAGEYGFQCGMDMFHGKVNIK